jgi:hypothetical protein
MSEKINFDKLDIFEVLKVIYKNKILLILTFFLSFLLSYFYFDQNNPKKNYVNEIVIKESLGAVVESRIIEQTMDRVLELISIKYDEILKTDRLYSIYEKTLTLRELTKSKTNKENYLYIDDFFAATKNINIELRKPLMDLTFIKTKMLDQMLNPLSETNSIDNFNFFKKLNYVINNILPDDIDKYINHNSLSAYSKDVEKKNIIKNLLSRSNIKLNDDNSISLKISSHKTIDRPKLNLLINFLKDTTISLLQDDLNYFIKFCNNQFDSSRLLQETLLEAREASIKQTLKDIRTLNHESGDKVNLLNAELSLIYSPIDIANIEQLTLKPFYDMNLILNEIIGFDKSNNDYINIFISTIKPTEVQTNLYSNIKFSSRNSVIIFLIFSLILIINNFRLNNVEK